jgi:hypothetical protein
VALRATLACYTANMHLPGDAVWLGLVAGSSTGKTETASALAHTPGVYVRATLSGEAALLSGTPPKDWAAGATGGLLRRVGDRGLLVLKDFTSILGMHREKRGVILAALREIYDGHWSREIGGEGGALLEWRGKLGLVMCSTTAYDRAHEVISQMGDRFLLIRLDDHEPEAGMLNALEGAGKEGKAREELAAAVAGLLGHPPEHRELAATVRTSSGSPSSPTSSPWPAPRWPATTAARSSSSWTARLPTGSGSSSTRCGVPAGCSA